jgi:hypothetical protein
MAGVGEALFEIDEVREHIVHVRRETAITYFCLRGHTPRSSRLW